MEARQQKVLLARSFFSASSGLPATSDVMTSERPDLVPSWLGCDSASRRSAKPGGRTLQNQVHCAQRRRTVQLVPCNSRAHRIAPCNARRSWVYSTTIQSSALRMLWRWVPQCNFLIVRWKISNGSEVVFNLRWKQLQQGQHLKNRCKLWGPTWQKQVGWAPEDK